MCLGEQRRDICNGEEIDNVVRDEAIKRAGGCLELERPIGLSHVHAATKTCEPCLSETYHSRTTIHRDITCIRWQVGGQHLFSERSRAASTFEDGMCYCKICVCDEVTSCGSFVESLQVLFGPHPVIKSSGLLMRQYSGCLWHF